MAFPQTLICTSILQVTRFTCGGITLAVNWAHAAADGRSGFHFMKSWSEIARGAEVSLLPDHRRQEITKPRIPPCATESPLKAVKSDEALAMELQTQQSTVTAPGAVREDPKVVTLDDAQNSEEVVAGTRADSKKETPKTQMRVFEFTKENVEHLKSVAAAPELTRADCVSAHLWRTVVRARGLPRHALVRMWVLLEGRKKLGLPPGYFGNVVGLTSAMATVDEVLSKPLTHLASLIHSSVSSVSGEYFLSFVDWIELNGEDVMAANVPLGLHRDTGVSYLNRFPFYELDFGFGIPSYSTRNNLGAWDGLLHIVPGHRNSYDMVVMTNLNPEVMPKFANLVHEFPTT